MTITTCDVCNRQIPNDVHHTPTKIDGKAFLYLYEGKSNEIRELTYSIRVESYDFNCTINCTSFALCRQCLIAAIHKSVEDQAAMPVVLP